MVAVRVLGRSVQLMRLFGLRARVRGILDCRLYYVAIVGGSVMLIQV